MSPLFAAQDEWPTPDARECAVCEETGLDCRGYHECVLDAVICTGQWCRDADERDPTIPYEHTHLDDPRVRALRAAYAEIRHA